MIIWKCDINASIISVLYLYSLTFKKPTISIRKCMRVKFSCVATNMIAQYLMLVTIKSWPIMLNFCMRLTDNIVPRVTGLLSGNISSNLHNDHWPSHVGHKAYQAFYRDLGPFIQQSLSQLLSQSQLRTAVLIMSEMYCEICAEKDIYILTCLWIHWNL